MTGYAVTLERLTTAQKTAYGAPAYSRWINRPLGRRIAAAAATAGLTPNQVTGISALWSLAGIAVLAVGPITPVTGIAAAVLLATGYAFDSADGQLARVQGSGGPRGEWLDHVVDMAKTVLVPGALAVSVVRHDAAGMLAAVTLVVAFTTVSVVAFFGWLLADLLRRAAPGTAPPARHGGAPVLRSLLRLPSDYGLLCWWFVTWGTPVFWWGFAALLVANAAILIAALPRWYHQAGATA